MVYESLPLDLVLRHVNLVHAVTLYVSENCFNIILLSGPKLLGVLFCFVPINIFVRCIYAFSFLIYLLFILPNHRNNIW